MGRSITKPEANEETTFARISKEAQGDFFIIV